MPVRTPRPETALPAAPGAVAAPDHPPVDWARELSRTAQAAATLRSSPQPKEFGYPHAHDPAPAAPQEFGWSHTRTHRVEAIPGGGLLVNLNDNCVLILAFPIPFAGCKLGKHPANGDLFKHMHDPPGADDPHEE